MKGTMVSTICLPTASCMRRQLYGRREVVRVVRSLGWAWIRVDRHEINAQSGLRALPSRERTVVGILQRCQGLYMGGRMHVMVSSVVKIQRAHFLTISCGKQDVYLKSYPAESVEIKNDAWSLRGFSCDERLA